MYFESTEAYEVVRKLKENGTFDLLRNECLACLDSRGGYQELKRRVEAYSKKALANQKWKPGMRKHELQEGLRIMILESGILTGGIEQLTSKVMPLMEEYIKPTVERIIQQKYSHGFDTGASNPLGASNPWPLPPQQAQPPVTTSLPASLKGEIPPSSVPISKSDDALDRIKSFFPETSSIIESSLRHLMATQPLRREPTENKEDPTKPSKNLQADLSLAAPAATSESGEALKPSQLAMKTKKAAAKVPKSGVTKVENSRLRLRQLEAKRAKQTAKSKALQAAHSQLLPPTSEACPSSKAKEKPGLKDRSGVKGVSKLEKERIVAEDLEKGSTGFDGSDAEIAEGAERKKGATAGNEKELIAVGSAHPEESGEDFELGERTHVNTKVEGIIGSGPTAEAGAVGEEADDAGRNRYGKMSCELVISDQDRKDGSSKRQSPIKIRIKTQRSAGGHKSESQPLRKPSVAESEGAVGLVADGAKKSDDTRETIVEPSDESGVPSNGRRPSSRKPKKNRKYYGSDYSNFSDSSPERKKNVSKSKRKASVSSITGTTSSSPRCTSPGSSINSKAQSEVSSKKRRFRTARQGRAVGSDPREQEAKQQCGEAIAMTGGQPEVAIQRCSPAEGELKGVSGPSTGACMPAGQEAARDSGGSMVTPERPSTVIPIQCHVGKLKLSCDGGHKQTAEICTCSDTAQEGNEQPATPTRETVLNPRDDDPVELELLSDEIGKGPSETVSGKAGHTGKCASPEPATFNARQVRSHPSMQATVAEAAEDSLRTIDPDAAAASPDMDLAAARDASPKVAEEVFPAPDNCTVTDARSDSTFAPIQCADIDLAAGSCQMIPSNAVEAGVSGAPEGGKISSCSVDSVDGGQNTTELPSDYITFEGDLESERSCQEKLPGQGDEAFPRTCSSHFYDACQRQADACSGLLGAEAAEISNIRDTPQTTGAPSTRSGADIARRPGDDTHSSLGDCQQAFSLPKKSTCCHKPTERHCTAVISDRTRDSEMDANEFAETLAAASATSPCGGRNQSHISPSAPWTASSRDNEEALNASDSEHPIASADESCFVQVAAETTARQPPSQDAEGSIETEARSLQSAYSTGESVDDSRTGSLSENGSMTLRLRSRQASTVTKVNAARRAKERSGIDQVQKGKELYWKPKIIFTEERPGKRKGPTAEEAKFKKRRK